MFVEKLAKILELPFRKADAVAVGMSMPEDSPDGLQLIPPVDMIRIPLPQGHAAKADFLPLRIVVELDRQRLVAARTQVDPAVGVRRPVGSAGDHQQVFILAIHMSFPHLNACNLCTIPETVSCSFFMRPCGGFLDSYMHADFELSHHL